MFSYNLLVLAFILVFLQYDCMYMYSKRKILTYHIRYVLTGSTQSQQGKYQYSLQQGYHGNSLQLLKLLHLPTLKIIFVLNYSI